MDTATSLATSRIEPTSAPPPASVTDPGRLVTVVATYQLSEDGRKASLLAGGDGRAAQKIILQMPASRLHLVTVDADGTARLKLRPRYHLDALQRVVRVDSPPTYDSPPTADDLLKEAGRNHQLERTYFAERSASRVKRREASRELRNRLAQQFLSDPAQRALTHPVPTPDGCYLVGPEGRVRFDVTSDEGPARQVPAEAHRRFRSDLRVRAGQKREAHAAQLAVYEEKKRVASEWIAAHGTEEQRTRQAAGVLPLAEVVELMTTETLKPLDRWPVYPLDGAERLQILLRQFPQHANAVVTPVDLAITVSDSPTASEAQWALVQEMQQALPGGTVTLRAHRITWKRDAAAPSLTVYGARMKYKLGPFTLCREYAASER
jgi:hypothetical protein